MADDFLTGIVAEKWQEIARRRREVPPEALWERCGQGSQPLPALDALRGPGLAVIAELKRGSPSAGVFNANLDASGQAAIYAEAGAAAISVLTDGPHFGGCLDDLWQARLRVAVPLLRKDFILDDYQLLEARAHGADMILLIVAALDRERLVLLLDAAARLRLMALVEVNTAREAALAVAAGAALVGINNRDLHTFKVDLGTTERLRPLLPPTTTVAALSGIQSVADARRMREAGADAVLVGEALVRSNDPMSLIHAMRGVP